MRLVSYCAAWGMGQAVRLVREGSTAFPQLGFESNSFDLGLWLRHEFLNCFENDPKLAVVFLFQFIEASGKPLVRADHLSKLNERSHDGDVDLDCPFAMEHAR